MAGHFLKPQDKYKHETKGKTRIFELKCALYTLVCAWEQKVAAAA